MEARATRLNPAALARGLRRVALAQGIAARASPLDLLRIDAPNSALDDFVLKFVFEACTTGLRPSFSRASSSTSCWHMYHTHQPLGERAVVRTVRLTHTAFWVEECAVPALALLAIERLELTGSAEFMPFLDDCLSVDRFHGAADLRTLPMTLVCRRAPPSVEEAASWLRVEKP